MKELTKKEEQAVQTLWDAIKEIKEINEINENIYRPNLIRERLIREYKKLILQIKEDWLLPISLQEKMINGAIVSLNKLNRKKEEDFEEGRLKQLINLMEVIIDGGIKR